jgi:hypothetical protein
MSRVRNLLRAILELLDEPRAEAERTVTAGNNPTEQPTEGLPPRPITELHIPQALVDRYDAAQQASNELDQQRARREKRALWISAATFAVVAFGTGVGIWNLILLRRGNEIATTAAGAATKAADAAEVSATASKDAAAAAGIQAVASKTQAGAALAANALTRQLARETQRARLTFSVGVEQEPTVEKPVLIFNMPIVLTGATDATRVRFTSAVAWLNNGLRPDMAKQDWTSSSLTWTNAGVVGVGEQNRAFRRPITASKDEVEAYVAGTKSAAMLLRVEYCDVFERRHHITRCAMRSPANPTVTYCGVDVDQNNGEQGQPECRP